MERFLETGSLPAPVERAGLAAVVIILLYHRPDSPNLRRWEARLKALLPGESDDWQRVLLLQALVYGLVWRGELREADALLGELGLIRERAAAPPAARLLAHLLGAMGAWCYGLFEEGDRLVRAGLAMAEETGVHVFDGPIVAQAIWGALNRDAVAEAESHLAGLSASLTEARLVEAAHYHLLRAYQELFTGRPQAARERLHFCLPTFIDRGAPFAEALNRILLGHALTETGALPEAQEELEGAEVIARGMRSSLLVLSVEFARSRLALRMGRREEALRAVGAGLRICREHGLWPVPFWRGPVFSELCALALEEGIEVEQARELVRARHLPAPAQAAWLEEWPWDLRIHALGRFEVSREGKPIRFPRKVPHKPWELLQTLVAAGRRGASDEQVADLLWADAEGDRAHRALLTAVYRLREIIGTEAVSHESGTIALDPSRVWVDSWAFEALLGGVTGDLERDERALGLYAGSFAAGSDRGYLAGTRERLRAKFLEGAMRLGRAHEEAGAWERAAAAYERALDAEVTELLCARLIHVYGELGRREEALLVLERLRREERLRRQADGA